MGSGFCRLAELDRSEIDPGSPKIGCRKRLLRTTNIATDSRELDSRASIAAQNFFALIKGENDE
jgi:hypothetical protein